MAKGVAKARFLSESNVKAVIKYLALLPEDRTVFKVTWGMISDYSGFSRQALQANSDIKKAYLLAKQGFRARSKPYLHHRASAKNSKNLINENIALRARVEQLEAREVFWKLRWYTVAYNIRQHGLQMERIDRPVPFSGPAMNQKEIQSILDLWNEPIPPVSS